MNSPGQRLRALPELYAVCLVNADAFDRAVSALLAAGHACIHRSG